MCYASHQDAGPPVCSLAGAVRKESLQPAQLLQQSTATHTHTTTWKRLFNFLHSLKTETSVFYRRLWSRATNNNKKEERQARSRETSVRKNPLPTFCFNSQQLQRATGRKQHNEAAPRGSKSQGMLRGVLKLDGLWTLVIFFFLLNHLDFWRSRISS